MSMWLMLAKIEPPLLKAVQEKPELIEALFFGGADAASPLSAFRPGADSYGYDYRIIGDIAEGRAEVEEDTADWTKAYPWLARSTGHGCDVVEDYEFGYGSAFVLTPDEVRQVAKGLVAEHWAGGTKSAGWDEESEDRGLEDLGPFFAAAAAEGKAVIGGVH